MHHIPRKRFGQHFLEDPFVIQQILAAMQLEKNDKVVEIGPGLGALTKSLLTKLPKLSAIEIDRDLQAHLEKLFPADRLTLIKKDALEVDYSLFGHSLRIVGNLPYNIGTAIILHCLRYQENIRDMHFMLQKEVAERLTAKPGSKDYGRLTVMVQYHCELEFLFEVPPEVFSPPPKVYSGVVRLEPYACLPYGPVDLKSFYRVLLKAFSMRRKTLFNNVKDLFTLAELERLGIDPKSRAEDIDVKKFVILANYLSNKGK